MAVHVLMLPHVVIFYQNVLMALMKEIVVSLDKWLGNLYASFVHELLIMSVLLAIEPAHA